MLPGNRYKFKTLIYRHGSSSKHGRIKLELGLVGYHSIGLFILLCSCDPGVATVVLRYLTPVNHAMMYVQTPHTENAQPDIGVYTIKACTSCHVTVLLTCYWLDEGVPSPACYDVARAPSAASATCAAAASAHSVRFILFAAGC